MLMSFQSYHVKQMHGGESSWKHEATKKHNPEGVRLRVHESLPGIVVLKLCEDFSSRSRKVEEE